MLRKDVAKGICKFRTSLFLLLFVPAGFSHAQVAIKNNLLYDAALTPNLGVEFRLPGQQHWTAALNVGYSPFKLGTDTERRWRHVLVMPEMRYWFCEAFARHFLGVNVVYSHYNASKLKLPLYSTEDFRYQGDLAGLGASWGYDIAIGKNKSWNIEFEVGADLSVTWYEKYACEHCGDRLGFSHRFFVLPKLGVNFAYLFPRKRVNKERMHACDDPSERLLINIPYIAPEPFVPKLSDLSLVGTLDTLIREHPVLAHISQYEPYTEDVVLRKKPGMLYVHFPLDKTELRRDYRDNGRVLDEIIHVTQRILADSVVSVKKIQIIGLASIEGPLQHNCDLGNGRARALQEYVQRCLPATAGMFDVNGGCEAWAEFTDQLQERVAAESPQMAAELQQALDIIASEDDLNVRERKLKRMNGGRTWNYIKEHILSDQRNSGYIRIYYDYVPDTNAKVINEASELLTTDCSDCHHEALRLLLTVRSDERALNALGTAYWLCGQQQEALDCFRRAAANGNADAKENLRQLEQHLTRISNARINNSNN